MQARLTVANSVASVSTTRPRLSVAVAMPQAVVDSVQAAAGVQAATLANSMSVAVAASEISYVLMKPSAVVDSSGLYSYFPDVSIVTDSVSLAPSKRLSDGIVLTDANLSRAITKGLSDAIEFSEVVTRTLVFIRSFAESVEIQSRPFKTLARPAADALVVSDIYRMTPVKGVLDGVSATDQSTRFVAKALQESQLVDTSKVSVSANKGLRESLSLADVVTRFGSKAIGDLLSTEDAATRVFAKSISDGFGLNDSAEALDGLLTQVSKSVANVVFASDVLTRSSGKQVSDAASVEDAKAISLARPLSDAFAQLDHVVVQSSKGVTDIQSVLDALRVSFTRPVADSFGLTEATSRSTGKTATDTQSLSDAGSLVVQGYCDPTYFAEDYVGEARNF